MRIRLRFFKFDSMKYIGHLDMLRFFQKAFRRANVPMKYSEGFHPHPVMSFAAPLGVGITSEGEYLDIETTRDVDLQKLIDDLNKEMVQGVSVFCARELLQNEKKAMAAVTAADYIVFLKKDASLFDGCDVKNTVDSFMKKESILVTKKTKKGERELDLKPFIYRFLADDFKNASFLKNLLIEIRNDEFACKDSDFCFFIRTSCGSIDNIKPELILTTCFPMLADKDNLFAIHRLDLYQGEYPSIVSLGELDGSLQDA